MLYISLLCFAVAGMILKITSARFRRVTISTTRTTHYKGFIIGEDGIIEMIPSIDIKA